MKILNKGFREACAFLSSQTNVCMPEWQPREKTAVASPPIDLSHLTRLVEQPRLSAEAQRFLFDERHIDPMVAEWMGLSSITTDVPMSGALSGGWFRAPALLLPYWDVERCRPLTVQARFLGHEPRARFQFPTHAAAHLYNLPALKMLRPGQRLYVCEGCSSTLGCLSAGHLAIGFASAMSTQICTHEMSLLHELASGHTWVCSPDRDRAGEQFYESLLKIANEVGACLIRRDLPADCKDYGDYWRKTSLRR